MSFLPSRVREARGELSLRDMAARLGVSHELVRLWELGDSEPHASELARLATVTGYPLAFFFRKGRNRRWP